jgi:rod shape-determining protein MreB
MDQLICEKMLRHKLFEIGLNTSEDIKMRYGSVFPDGDEEEFEVLGLDRRTHRPGRMNLRTEVLRDFLEPLTSQIEQRLKEHLRRLPPEIQQTVADRGVHFVGGGALLRGWKNRLEQRLGITVTIPHEPQYAVIRGMQKVLAAPRRYEPILRISEIVN